MTKIVQYPNEILKKVAESVDITNKKEVAYLTKELNENYALLSNNKVGLACPQIGISKRAVIVLGKVIFNSEFRPANQIEIAQEGCFSVENASVFQSVARPKYGWASWIDGDTLEKKEEKLNGFPARVFQHELDHLNGVLCIEK